MAVLNEERITLGIHIKRNLDGSDSVIVFANSFDDTNSISIRSGSWDATSALSQARIDGIAALMNDAVAYIKQRFDLPADVIVGELPE